jgi:tRNA A-37 threonylcarbamoyl transferase component Bud32
MKNLALDEFNQLTQYSTVLAEDGYGKKVIQLSDQSIIKLFRIKRFISSATVYSPARRFARNAEKLKHLHIPTVTIIKLFRIKAIKRTAVHYQKLEGLTVREYLQAALADNVFFEQLGQFLACLHNHGIYFRSAHFGNIIYTPDQKFGLIDISDMKISPFSLNQNKRLRNLKHIFRLREDMELIQQTNAIQSGYLNHSHIQSPGFRKKFLNLYQHLNNQYS